ncbi:MULTISPECIES: carbon-nitrogen hydrolase family protein [Clostridium]|uniref:2-oxoglutaramate amidase n=3 Tax=Clostridium TaxID=1485 RepID=D8GJN8_CLOLD|nr:MULTISPECIES: carbon-nitrogen hydrolase family protein [Clostridium]ADK15199.1 predicted hydrolase [Clostridium ljungdahlii DSM 13528]ALU34646.1 Omega-amidase [Clostridium autoethanogenum DSM 10061]OAA88679.1 2-oxoglutaramate amidase [Clostridium ljungdahlii DSM 13528]OVY51366.1 2-oxoglutaramate amidase [Clostridium autoethanogenum]DAD54098.1 TPA_exp: Omega-amidase NIT2 [Clostridium autoethanogenum DSM 10061]
MVKIGLCQMKVLSCSKKSNIEKAKSMIVQATDKGADIVVLPEMFNCPYDIKNFREYAEAEYCYGDTLKMLSSVSREKKILLIGGSIPELDQKGNVYNTSFVFNKDGNLIGKHRKMHLFDIDIKNKITFKESKVLTPGNKITIIDTKWGKIGIAICYDIRFPELIRLMALNGAKIVFIPAAFNMTTGPAHWELLFRSRAVDNQIYIAGISPARDINYSYVAYGHSLVVNPWGTITDILDEKEGILISELDLDYINDVRESLPIIKNRRKDIYDLTLLR